jgi:hypothetical protein
MENLSHIGDILAIPLFFILFVYFYKLNNKTPLEYFLMLFALSGFILDTYFTYFWLYK